MEHRKNHKTTMRLAAAVTCLALVLLAGGCGKGGEASSRGSNSPAGVDSVLSEGVAEYEGTGTEGKEAGSGTGAGSAAKQYADPDGESSGDAQKSAQEKSENSAKIPADGKYDIDLTSLSSTIVYTEVFNMMNDPTSYIGKTVRMNGTYAMYHAEETDQTYFACIIKDAAACCAQGLEFVLDDTYSYPQDYPAEGEDITVAGVFDTYLEDGNLYCTVRDAQLLDG